LIGPLLSELSNLWFFAAGGELVINARSVFVHWRQKRGTHKGLKLKDEEIKT